MPITFFIQSKKDPAPIYIRVREGKIIDAKARTNFSVNVTDFQNGKIKITRVPAKADEDIKIKVKSKNKELIDLQNDLDTLKAEVNNRLNSREDYELIDTNWLKNYLNPKKDSDVPNVVSEYFYYYKEFKKKTLADSTLRQLKTFGNRIKLYELENGKLYLQQVNRKFSISFQKWMDDNDYDHNTKVNTIKKIKTICNHAKANGIKLHPEFEYINEGLSYKKVDNVHLNFDELLKIKNIEIENKRLDNARDWLIISCFTAQRVSDFLGFSMEDIVVMDGVKLLDINQDKTGKPIYIPMNNLVYDVLKKNNGFPPQFSKNKSSNSAIYNKLIKEVCRLAKIDDLVIANKKDAKINRSSMKEMPKYRAVSSHIGRRSFATNYYGKIATSLLIAATGHSTEKQFLIYVGKTEKRNAIDLAKALDKIDIQEKVSKMRIIKNIANE